MWPSKPNLLIFSKLSTNIFSLNGILFLVYDYHWFVKKNKLHRLKYCLIEYKIFQEVQTTFSANKPQYVTSNTVLCHLHNFNSKWSICIYTFHIINCYRCYVHPTSNYHFFCLSLCETYWAKPTSLGVLLTSLEPIFVLGVADSKLSSSSFVMLPFKLCVSHMVFLFSSDFIGSPFEHVLKCSSYTSQIVVLASTNWSISLLYAKIVASYVILHI